MNYLSSPQSKLTAVDFNPFADGELLLTAPATESQKEIWASVRMGRDANCAYNESQKLWLRGLLNVDALRSALQEIVLRHEALRTNFSPDGVTLCIVASLNLEIPEIDLSGLDLAEREQALANILKQAVENPFNLEHGSLIRLQLIKTQDQEHLLLMTAHHIICDGWSWAVLMTDLGKLYTALKNGEAPELDEPECFSEYAIAQQESKGSEEELETEAYWLEQFANSIPVLDFPTDRPRPPFRTFSAAQEDWDLDPALVRNLKQLGNKLGCSFTTTLLTSFEVFLHRLTGSNEIMVGIPAAGQAATGNYQLVGHCVNLLPLKSFVDGSQAFTDYLQMRRPIILDAYDYQQFTFGSLLGKLAIPRDNSRIPLVPITFNLEQGLDNDRLLFEDLKVEFSTNPRSYENFEISINATEMRGKVILECQYNTNLFDAATIRHRLAEFETLLSGIVAAPDTIISRLPLLPETELQLLTSWNQTQIEYPHDKCIHQLFEEQVERTPNAIAVSFQDQKLTYRELNSRANQLAHYLQNLGVKPDVLVGICVERSLEMIVGLLGILKAGGAYVPLDPSYPQERIEYMIADAQMPLLLTQAKWNIQEHQSQVICLDSDWEKIASQNSDNPAPINENKHVAYVIYTSGSTGKPKGVMIGQKALVSFVQTAISEYGFSESDRVLQFASINFDAAVEEIYPSLCTGATLVLRTDKMLSDLRTFFQACEDLRLTVLDLPTAYWHQLAAELANTSESFPESLRLVIIGGEKVLLEPVRDWQQYVTKSGKGDRLQLINTYGPTETTVVATLYRIPNTFSNISEVPIGRPLAHLQTYILDPQLQLVPIGVTGELHIGGDSLAIGYLKRPELTGEKFIPNPFSSQSGSRLYKTGDLARYLSDGNIEYLGRIDNQVKIRGFRIELGEVETALSQHPHLRATVVTTREDTPGDKRLVAYVVAEDQSQDIDLRAFLKERLPSYMIPSAFVFLEAMPITPNGKIDYRSLPAPDTSSIQLEKNFIPPRNPTEETLAKIWSHILGVERVSINDDFFELGGHSLLSVRLISEIEKTFNYQIPLSSFFEMGTIAEMAKWMREKPSETISAESVPEGLSIEDYRAFLSLCGGRIGKHIGKRGLIVEVPPTEMKSSQPFVWIGYIDFAKNLGLPQPVYTIPGGSWTPLHSTENYIEAIASVIVDELLSVPQDEPYLIGGNCYEGIVAAEVAYQLQKKGKKVAFLAIIDKPGSSKTYDRLCKLDLKLCILKFHFLQLLPLSLADKGKYIMERLFSFNTKQEISKPESERESSQSKTTQSPPSLKRPLNEHDLILPQAWDSIDQVSRNHKSKGFFGKVILTAPTKSGLKSGTKDVLWTDLSWLFPRYGWEKLLTGKVELHRLDYAHADVGVRKNAEQIGLLIWNACEEFR